MEGTKQYILCMKLKVLKQPLKTLNRLDFSHISKRVKKAQDDYVIAQKQVLNNPTSSTLKSTMVDCRRHANFLLEAERQFLQQKMKTKHLLFADRGTSYFHSLVKKRNFVSTIPALIKAGGESTTSQEEVIDELLNFYNGLLCVDIHVNPISPEIVQNGPIISEDDSSYLSVAIDDLTIKDALFSIGDEKAPGPDGYTAAFFKHRWDIIKDDFFTGS